MTRIGIQAEKIWLGALFRLMAAFAVISTIGTNRDFFRILMTTGLIPLIAFAFSLVGLRKPLWIMDALFIKQLTEHDISYLGVCRDIAVVFLVDNLALKLVHWFRSRRVAGAECPSVKP